MNYYYFIYFKYSRYKPTRKVHVKIVGGHHCLSFLMDASRCFFVWLCLLNYSLFISPFFLGPCLPLLSGLFKKLSYFRKVHFENCVEKRAWLAGRVSLLLIVRFFMIHTFISFLSSNKISVWSWLDSGYTRSNSQLTKWGKVENESNQCVDALAKFIVTLSSNYVNIWWGTCGFW